MSQEVPHDAHAPHADEASQERLHEKQRREPLAFHIRRLRLWHGAEGLTQEELAAIAGVSKSAVEEYERRETLPVQVQTFIQIMLALGEPLERIIAPHALHALWRDVEGRRTAFNSAPDFRHVADHNADADAE